MSTSTRRDGRRTGRRVRRVALGLALACHTGPTVVVTALSGAVAIAVGAPAVTVVLVVLSVLLGQLSIGWSNDWIDAPRDLAVARPDKPVVRGLVGVGTLRMSAVVAGLAGTALPFALGPAAGMAHLVVVASGWAYNAGLKSTVWSWLPYAAAFGALPAFVVLALPGDGRPAAWVVGVGALLGVGAHLANVLPDLDDDAATGVRGLPHVLGRRPTGVLAPVLLATGAATSVLAPAGAPGAGVVVVGALAAVVGAVAGTVGLVRPTSRLPFTLAMVVAGLCVVALVASVDAAVV
ncbi:UbiA family prenyltransferase [Actinotalea sp. Marseille-Q4924]|uniref:UbiA family prenyltransferase n=1 Tax=Actinotalea sp. Marseille-Q4924 TaxID=2866571 RepID=UPI001CE41205|nr:UbiA family prenyltransferase [Actinotalea sp. Marseille-Q4924]